MQEQAALTIEKLKKEKKELQEGLRYTVIRKQEQPSQQLKN